MCRHLNLWGCRRCRLRARGSPWRRGLQRTKARQEALYDARLDLLLRPAELADGLARRSWRLPRITAELAPGQLGSPAPRHGRGFGIRAIRSAELENPLVRYRTNCTQAGGLGSVGSGAAEVGIVRPTGDAHHDAGGPRI